MDIKVGFVTLGCPKNTCDTEVMLGLALKEGFEIVTEDIDADVMVINTCAFIESAKEESINSIIDIAYLKEHHKLRGIVVTGCLATRYADDIEKSLPEVDVILSAGDEADIVEAIKKAYNKEKAKYVSPTENLPLGGDRVVTTPEYTAYLKIAEGCDNRCTYCAIPDIRGKFRSRPMDDVIAESHDLFDMGVRELNVVAQDTTRYGEDLYGRYALAELLEKLSAIPFKWIRILYCYPDKITDELCSVMASHGNILHYIDMPIQHISDDVLRRMNRHGGSDVIRSSIKKLRDAMPDIVIRTTVIVGFPGETSKNFKELYDFIKEVKFERLGAFEYSREEGTPAYGFDSQVTKKTKHTRCESIMEAQYNIHYAYNSTLVGKTLEVLVEDYDKVAETYYGRSRLDAPDIDSKVYFSSRKKLDPGEFVNVRINEIIDYDLLGEVVK